MIGEEHILWDVVEEHLDEAEFLVEQWCSARVSPDHSLEELRDGPESRLLAHVDGVVVNGPLALQQEAWPIIEQSDVPSLVTAAAMTVLESGDFRVLGVLDGEGMPAVGDSPGDEEDGDGEGDPDDVIPLQLDRDARDFLASAPPYQPAEGEEGYEEAPLEGDADGAEPGPAAMEVPAEPPPVPQDLDEHRPAPRARALGLALALSSHPRLDDEVRRRLLGAEGPTLALLLRACADRGLDPGAALDRALLHDDPVVVIAALRAAVFGSRQRLLAPVEALLQHPVQAVRQAALDTAMAWGSRAAWEMVTYAYARPGGRGAMVWAACLGDDRHAEAVVALLHDEALRNDALWALGFSGRVPAVLACMTQLDAEDETTRRLAGEAVAAIVGLDPDDESLWEDQSAAQLEEGIEGDDPDEDDDDLDADLSESPEDELRLPDATAIRRWWSEHQGAFVPGQRYLLGKPVGKEGPGWALSRISCRRIDVVAREVVARSHGVGRWPARMLASRQQRAAEALTSLGAQAGVMRGDRR